MPKPILIDTDTGVDDALALIIALRSPEVSVKAITTVAGNVEVHKCTRNVLYLLQLLNADDRIIVAQGAAKPLKRKLFTAPEVHGSDGLGNTMLGKTLSNKANKNAVDEILAFCKRYKQRGTIVALGPLTNLARAYKKNPAIIRTIGSIVTMGGAFRVRGNTGPVAEFNYYVDPEAAQYVLQSGLPVTVVPLDLTEQVRLTREDFARRAARRPSPVAKAILNFTKFYMQYHNITEDFNGGYAHDPVAVAIAVDPTMVNTRRAHISVETQNSYTRGMTSADFRNAREHSGTCTSVAVNIDRQRFLTFFHGRLWT